MDQSAAQMLAVLLQRQQLMRQRYDDYGYDYDRDRDLDLKQCDRDRCCHQRFHSSVKRPWVLSVLYVDTCPWRFVVRAVEEQVQGPVLQQIVSSAMGPSLPDHHAAVS